MLIYIFIFFLTFISGWFIPILVKNRKNYLKIFQGKKQEEILEFKVEKLIFGFVNGSLNTFISYKVITESEVTGIGLILLIIFLIKVISWLVFITYYDLIYFEVPDKSSIFFVVFLVLLNLGLVILGGRQFEFTVFTGNQFSPLHNLAAGIIYAGFILFFVVITKGKGMGGGDIRIAGIIGLFLGRKLILSFYITSFIGLIIAIVVFIVKRNIKGVKVPFVPLMTAGAILSFISSTEVNRVILNFLLSR